MAEGPSRAGSGWGPNAGAAAPREGSEMGAEGGREWGLPTHQPASKPPRWGSVPPQGLRSLSCLCVVSPSPRALPLWCLGSPPSQHEPVPSQERGRAEAANRTASEGLRKLNLPPEI